jgi:hypothetical protein
VLGRNIIIGPPTHDFDFAMLKRFPLGREERYLQFRSEFFNAFPNFDNPNVTETSSTFGKIISAGVQPARQLAPDAIRTPPGVLICDSRSTLTSNQRVGILRANLVVSTLT